MLEGYRVVKIPEGSALNKENELYERAAAILDKQGVHYGDIMGPGNPLHDLVQTLREPSVAGLGENPCGEIPTGV